MARLPRAEVIDPNEVTIVHVISRTVRRCFLLGDDPVSGKNFDHRKVWIEEMLEQFAAYFGIDLLAYSLLSTHYHLILRTRPDMVASWDDTEVARRWLMICPQRKERMGTETVLGRIRTGSLVGEPVDFGQTMTVAFETNVGRTEEPLRRRSGSQGDEQ